MASRDTLPSRRWSWIALAAAVVVVGFFFLFRASRPSVTVQAVQVTRRDISSIVSTNGIVQPILDFQAHATVPGEVEKLFVRVGDTVQSGQQLVELDTTDAANRLATAQATLQGNEQGLHNMEQGGTQDEVLSSRADINAARTLVNQDQQTLDTRQKLQASGAASPNEVAQAKEKLAQDQAHLAELQNRKSGRYASGDLAAQRALVTQAQTAVSAARSDYAAADIRAPFAGTVYSVGVSQYDFVQAGSLLLNLADLTRLRVRAYFDEPEVGRLSRGEPVTIEWAAKPNQVWHGHIEVAPTTVTGYTTRNVGEGSITVDDARGDLLPNANVTVHVTTQRRQNALVLPREALHTEGTDDFVLRVVDGKLVRTHVGVGLSNVVQFEITSGLKDGDVVALHSTNETDLTDGLRVNVQREQP